MLPVRGEYFDNYKLLCKLEQVVRGHSLQPNKYDDETIQGITCLIIEGRSKYFR